MAINETYVQNTDNRYVTRFSMGDSLDDYKSVIKYALEDPDINSEYNESGAIENILGSIDEPQLTAKRRDTSIGGNDAINCYYQFNENDDLVHPINRVGTDPYQGLGRVYNEIFDEQQQLLYMSFGVPEFTNISAFLSNSYNTDLATLMNTGDVSLVTQVSRFLGKVLGVVIMFPFLPIKAANWLFNKIFLSPTKYYDFKPTMALYYKQVNVILAHLAVNMNLLPSGSSPDATAADGEFTEKDMAGTPRIIRDHGLDILTILSRRYYYDNLGKVDKRKINTDDMMEELKKNINAEKMMWETGTDGFLMGVTEAMKYVGFRIEKSVDSSESASNNTKTSNLANMINGAVSTGRDLGFNLGAMRGDGVVGSAFDNIVKSVSGVVSGVADSVGITGGVEALKGAGYIDIPEVWDNSTFNKSYSFNFQLRSPSGDKYSIFYSLYVPLALLIAGAFPRSVGQNAYTSPFLVRAYSKGMFAIPLGIIDSITITRGSSEYGWSRDMLPTQIDVSFTVKDLSPVLHVAMVDGSIGDWASIFGQNSTFQEYLLTLSGANIADSSLRLRLFKKRQQALRTILSNNVFNPLMVGYSLSNTRVGNILTDIWPVSRLPGAVPKPSG